MTYLNVRCKAHKSTNGEPCKNFAIRGAVVCRNHGGATPQVKRKAKERLADLVDPAIAKLQRLIEDEISSVALGACKDILDRNGLGAVAPEDQPPPAVSIEVKSLALLFTTQELQALRERLINAK